MTLHKLEGTDAFIVFDLADAPHNVGVTRLAPKILVDGATLLARSLTYLFATFEQQAGGASAGINAKPEDRDAAVAAFVAEVEPLVASGRFLTEAGRGLRDEDLAPLRAVDPRVGYVGADAHPLVGLSVAAAADAVAPLAGRTVAIEGLEVATVGVVAALADRGARLVGVSTTAGALLEPAGLDAAALTAAIVELGPAGLEQLGPLAPAAAVFGAEAEVLCPGSKVGVIDHEVAAAVTAGLVVPLAPVPVTAKALAVLRRAEVVVLPDFVTTCGPLFAMFPAEDATPESVAATVVEHVDAALGEVLGHVDGPLLAACYRAEAFLRTWCDPLPFGRPLA